MPLTSAEEFGAETLVCGAHKARLSSPRPEQEDLSVRCATIHRPINGSPIHEFSKDQEKKTGEGDNAVLIWRRDYPRCRTLHPKKTGSGSKRFI
jgi:hypothetical protein